MGKERLLTISEVCAILRDDHGRPLSKATFYRWRTIGRAPQCLKLPNGQLRVRDSALDEFLDKCTEAA
ncbi:helix-turn-helix domain-containing protein [Actinospica sp. MGRD01-02]|uniref:Helix-turn-helix domain-containing protein n=1 Tax=Actinospica acidithermotolerans TaxID=2828514 RepID=A0A941EEY7_9ACTN|nr:helix-turn-helix domain-containing protein [Actinospica acidithermotolerans]MBR7829252.1 helix-turn-helix domain-containing protein [Actinospica acidithermotolerans]